MPQNVDPKVDYAFKKLFGSEANKDLLIDLLSSVLDEQVRSVQLLNPFEDPDYGDEKSSILDVSAMLSDGRIAFVEMQMWLTPQYPGRMLYYWAKPYSKQLKKGEPYGTLKPVIAIFFIDDVLLPNAPHYRQRFRVTADSNPELVLTPNLVLHTVELPKFELHANELSNGLDRWCYFLKNGPSLTKELLPAAMKTSTMERAVEELNIMTYTEKERMIYEARMKSMRDFASWKIDSKIEGKIEGKLEGKAEGKAESFNQFRDSIESGLKKKFGANSAPLIESLRSIKEEAKLREIIENLMFATTVEEYQQVIR